MGRQMGLENHYEEYIIILTGYPHIPGIRAAGLLPVGATAGFAADIIVDREIEKGYNCLK